MTSIDLGFASKRGSSIGRAWKVTMYSLAILMLPHSGQNVSGGPVFLRGFRGLGDTIPRRLMGAEMVLYEQKSTALRPLGPPPHTNVWRPRRSDSDLTRFSDFRI